MDRVTLGRLLRTIWEAGIRHGNKNVIESGCQCCEDRDKATGQILDAYEQEHTAREKAEGALAKAFCPTCSGKGAIFIGCSNGAFCNDREHDHFKTCPQCKGGRTALAALAQEEAERG